MAIVIRKADIYTERQSLINLLYQYLTKQSNEQRFDWLYRDNPHGPARVWVAIDTRDHAIIGMSGAFPRHMYVGEREELGWVLGDFCVNDQYRSLGPALQLQRACLADVDSGAIRFCYDFPSRPMMAIYKRLGINPSGQMFRLAKPLRVDRKVEEIIKIPLLARGISAAGNFFLTLYNRRSRHRGAGTISLHEGTCGEEFSLLARQVAGRYGVCIQRSAEYLNWRYVTNPLRRYELLTVRRNGVLLAYVVFNQNNENAVLVDLFGVEEPETITSLVDGAISLLWKRGVVTVSIPMLESHPWFTLLQQMGFKAREADPVVIYASSNSPLKQSLIEGFSWFLMDGDRDS